MKVHMPSISRTAARDPICEDCHGRGMKSNVYGKKDQQKAAAMSTGAKRKAKAAAATGLGRGRRVRREGLALGRVRMPYICTYRI